MSAPPLPLALQANKQRWRNTPAALLGMCRAQPDGPPSGPPPPLVLRSMNMAGSAAEMAPLCQHLRRDHRLAPLGMRRAVGPVG